MKIYLAAQYSQKHEIALKKQELQGLGFIVTSTWMEEPDDPNVSLKDVRHVVLAAYASRDVEEIDAADMLVLFTVDPDERTRRGGRHVEYGYALGRGKAVCIVGPQENIFHHLLPADLCFPSWGHFVDSVSGVCKS